MNTNDDIELHDLQTIEASLCTELPADAPTPEGESAAAGGAVLGTGSGFLVT